MTSSSRRLKGEQFCCPIIYGSIAAPIGKKDPPPSDPTHTHRWTIFFRAANGQDLSHVIKRVSFKLHESFVPPTRVVETQPFEVTETGWGEFEIVIKLSFVDSQEKTVTLFHQLQLYPKEDPLGEAVDMAKQPIISEHYDELVFNEPFEEFIEPLRRFRDQVVTRKISSQFTAQMEAQEIKKLYTQNEKVMADLEKWKTKLARVEAEKRKLEAEIRQVEEAI
ncbi:protein AF-9 [Chytriomyces sp. MP71]|nr:protein AF-9 [Chytriomyces sp. MP71]